MFPVLTSLSLSPTTPHWFSTRLLPMQNIHHFYLAGGITPHPLLLPKPRGLGAGAGAGCTDTSLSPHPSCVWLEHFFVWVYFSLNKNESTKKKKIKSYEDYEQCECELG